MGYRDEIGIIITNIEPKFKDLEFEYDEIGRPILTSILHGQSYTITEGTRFAQLVLSEVPAAAFYQVAEVKEIGFNRDSGFGGTGI